MTTIAGKYFGTVITDLEEVSDKDFFVEVEQVNQNIISVTFERFEHRFKLTCVIHQEDNQYNLHVMDKFTAKFHVQGTGLKKYYKSGVHGLWNSHSGALKLDLIINEFNKDAVRFSFMGEKSEESSQAAPLGDTNLLFL